VLATVAKRVLPLVLGALWLAVPAPAAEQAGETVSPERVGPAETQAGTPREADGRRRARGARRTPVQWWAHAREVLLEGLALSDEQAQRVDGIIESQVGARRRARDLQDELRLAQRQNDVQRGATLRAELRANRANLKDPYLRIEEIRAVLSEEQHPTFDMNRARLVAESQRARDARKRRLPKKAGQAAYPKLETE
jgi:hypothetical protein